MLKGFPLAALIVHVGKWPAVHVERSAHRKAARRDLLSERRADFQRQTLIDLQDSVADLIRSAARVNHADIMAYRQGTPWEELRLPADLDTAFHLAQVKTTRLMVRVRDDQIRDMVYALKSASAAVGRSSSPAESDKHFGNASQIFDTLNDRVGVVLRTLEDEEI